MEAVCTMHLLYTVHSYHRSAVGIYRRGWSLLTRVFREGLVEA